MSAIVLDFNNARPQGHFAPRQLDDPHYVRDLKERMALHYRAVLQHLWPNGRFVGAEFEVGDVHGSPGRSLKISCRRDKLGVGCDFAGNETFGDLIDAWAYATRGHKARGRDFAEVCEEIEGFLGRPFKAPSTPPPAKAMPRELPPPTAQFTYADADGRPLVVVYRHDLPELNKHGKPKKEFMPWLVAERRYGMPPKDRPLYNLPGIRAEPWIVFVEGEGKADALIAIGIPATCALGGSKSPPEMTDWSPLAGKHVVIWPDADEEGEAFAAKVAEALRPIAASVAMVKPPAGKPKGWDAKDALAEGLDVREILNAAIANPAVGTDGFDLAAWSVEHRYLGEPPPRRWLVDQLFPLGSAGLLAARGGAGKSMLVLDLALKVVCDDASSNGLIDDRPRAFGMPIMENGAAVIFTGEDGAEEIHRRLHALDLQGRRLKARHKLYIVPIVDAGGPWTLIRTTSQGPELTRTWHAIERQLAAVEDLKLIVFDPLSALVACDLNSSEETQFVMSAFARLASTTRALALVCHHMTKGHAKGGGIQGTDVARDAIRGSTSLVDGGRFAYALWPADEPEARSVLKRLGEPEASDSNRVYKGTVTKINAPSSYGVRTFLRDKDTGLLRDVSEPLALVRSTREDLMAILAEKIAAAAASGHPFTATGVRGVFAKRDRLGEELAACARHKLEGMVADLLKERRILRAAARGEKAAQWLDVPGGLFATGQGMFAEGAEEANDGS